MIGGGFFVADENGMPDYFFDPKAVSDGARQLSNRLALASRDREQVFKILRDEILAVDIAAEARLILAVSVLDTIVPGVLGPLLTFAEDQGADAVTGLRTGGDADV